MKTIIAIDPGLKGAISIIGKDIKFFPMPLIGKEIDILSLQGLIEQNNSGYNDTVIILEDVHAIFGASAKSTFNFGYICGQINTVCCQTGFIVQLVSPKVWQKEIWIKEDMVYKPTKRFYKESKLPMLKTETKQTSFNAVKRIFPNIMIPTTPKSKVPHDGIVDSILLAEFGKRTIK